MPTVCDKCEHPILFTGEMVRAILDGRKTQTRRVIKPQPDKVKTPVDISAFGVPLEHENRKAILSLPDIAIKGGKKIKCPYGGPGDRLWVRETWAPRGDKGRPFYRADEQSQTEGYSHIILNNGRWRPSIHMPRWASRLLLEVTDVRAERVQSITAADCCDEGVLINCSSCSGECAHLDQSPNLKRQVRRDFRSLWDSINAKRGFGWDANPWVWAITFKVIENEQ